MMTSSEARTYHIPMACAICMTSRVDPWGQCGPETVVCDDPKRECLFSVEDQQHLAYILFSSTTKVRSM